MRARLPLATEQELKVMDGGQKYFRYLYDLETVYIDVIALLNTTTPRRELWKVEQTGGMCCVLSTYVDGTHNGVDGCFMFAVCPDGNLHLDDDITGQTYLVGWEFLSVQRDKLDEGECLYDVSCGDLVATVRDLMTSLGVEKVRGFSESFAHRHGYECATSAVGMWEPWSGDCDICGRVRVVGFCDRCTECAIESVYENEREYGGTTEHVMNHFGIKWAGDRCPRILDRVVEKCLEYQAQMWRVAL